MEKLYERIYFENAPSKKTPLNRENLDKMDKAIGDLDDRIIEETTHLKSDLSNRTQLDTKMDILKLTQGYIAIGTNAVVDLEIVTPLANFYHQIVKCKAGETYYISGQGGSAPRLWALVEDDGTVIERASDSLVANDVELKITRECNLVYNTSYQSNNVSLKCIPNINHFVENFNGAIENVLATEFLLDVSYKAEDFGVLTPSVGSRVDMASTNGQLAWKHIVIKCKKGAFVRITGRGGASSRLWAIVDENGIITSMADSDKLNDKLTIEKDCTLLINVYYEGYKVEVTPSYDLAIEYILTNKAEVARHDESLSNFTFGTGIDCKYTTPTIGALTIPEKGARTDYFYSLYDALAAKYPEYITKIDCDAGVASEGITKPDYMAEEHIYLYKFAPKFTPKTTNQNDTTSANVLKLFIVTGTHPEYMAIWDCYHTMKQICENWKNDDNLDALRWECEIYVMPCSVPYCIETGSRTNYNGVDLNRNMPTSDWRLAGEGTDSYSGTAALSEYESKVLDYYFKQINPSVFIDHHNTSRIAGHHTIFYTTSRNQRVVNIGAQVISAMTRRWKKRFPDVFPSDDVTTIFGFSQISEERGLRSTYANENGAVGITYESICGIPYINGEFVGTDSPNYDSISSTVSTDGFINFLLFTLKQLSICRLD